MRIIPVFNSKLSRIWFFSLCSLAALIILLLLTGTIFALARSDSSDPVLRLGRSGKNGRQMPPGQVNDNDIRVFSGIGRLRIPLSNSSTLILSVAFPYFAGDTVFTEELAGKIADFREIAGGYFSSLSEEQLFLIDEEAAKTEILRRFNANLRLGRIETLYFTDFLIIDSIS